MRHGLATDAWKRTVDDYVKAAHALHASMERDGYVGAHPIPIDPSGELLGGAHRLACALALKEPFVKIERRPNAVWAPPWHREWFIENGMPPDELKRLDADWDLMHW